MISDQPYWLNQWLVVVHSCWNANSSAKSLELGSSGTQIVHDMGLSESSAPPIPMDY